MFQSKTALYFVLMAMIITTGHQASAEGALRERIRESIRERMAEKITGKIEGDEQNKAVAADIGSRIVKSGDYSFSIPVGDLSRAYRVHIPSRYNPQNPTPLVVAFHGGGGSMNYMARDDYYGLITKSDTEGFIVVFPNGYSKFKSGIFATWNAGNCCGDARDKKVDDIQFIRTMISTLSKQLNIDPHRIFATGMSNGGMMSYGVACELPDVFKAIASVAGTDNTVTCSHKTPISILHIHAQNDDHVLFNGGAGEGAFKDPSKVTDFTSVPETIHRWVTYNHCSPSPNRVLTVNGAYCDLYSGCANGTQVKLCVTETGGHSWPGGNKPRGESPSQAISANDMLWDFFKSQK